MEPNVNSAAADIDVPIPGTAIVRWKYDDGRMRVRYTPNLAEILGEPSGWYPTELAAIVQGADISRVSDADVRNFLQSPFTFLGEDGILRLHFHKHGHWLELQAHVDAAESVVNAMVCLTSGPTRGQRDDLTGLLNAGTFRRMVKDLPDAVFASGGGVYFRIDLDGFKLINDNQGHDAGDNVLGRLGASLRSLENTWPGRLLIGRVGGDEFAGVLFKATPSERELFIEQLTAATDKTLELLNHMGEPVMIRVAGSVGITEVTNSHDFAELNRQADLAQYMAKGQKGQERRRPYRYRPELDSYLAQRNQEVRTAWQDDKITSRYEPLVDRTCQVIGLEVLSRWKDGERIRLPAAFLGELSAQGYLIEHDFKTILQAAKDISAIQRATGRDGLRLHANITPSALGLPNLVSDWLVPIFRNSGLDPSQLVLEVLESESLPPRQGLEHNLRQLAQMGVGLALDDFGEGHSNLLRYREMQEHCRFVKLSRLWLDGISPSSPSGRGQASLQLIKAQIAMLHSIGCQVIVEGVDNIFRLRALSGLGPSRPDGMQGYLFAGIPGVRDASQTASAFDRDGVIALLAGRLDQDWRSARQIIAAL